jgi:hypothetical protein
MKHKDYDKDTYEPRLCMNYSFCELMDLGVKIDEDWCNVGNIDYDALDDLQDDYPYLFEDEAAEIPSNGWDEITQEITKHGDDEALDMR